MLLPPEDVDLAALGRHIDRYYTADRGPFEFVPLGEDSWSFRRGDLWVSLRRDLRGHVPSAYEAAHALGRSGAVRVLAPLRGTDGRVVHEFAGYPVVVFPYRVCDQLGAAPGRADAVVELIHRVHAAHVPVELPRETYAIDFEPDLCAALAFADADPPDGGHPARLHRLLRRHRDALDALRTELAGLGTACAADPAPFVLTHGEPSAANILRDADGLLLADWGGARWGPPERDWFHVHRTLGIDVPSGRPQFHAFYRVRWQLSEIAEYATRFRTPRPGDAEDAAMWNRLLRYLPPA